ncbi:predicted protein [Naegleria gruberi]|uniref:Predicted protein n=1 Tax=Naegleria gruberi TaxID=5762 RepID=D2W273_NAEGR|nr:uncharacterized protein NAEGRDRAFT_75484 [Naegleria gruberi]EFC36772.1 predicted protein [Naegleria gruberi]|eukprot:XP_002669516.1 predicted protein [Naegleria gruberi strain NEG-M]
MWKAEQYSEQLLNSIIEERKLLAITHESMNAKDMLFKVLKNRLGNMDDDRDFDEKFYPCDDDFRVLVNKYHYVMLKDERFFEILSENYKYLIPEMLYLIEFGEKHDIDIPLKVRQTFGLDFYRTQMKLDQLDPDHKYLTTLLVAFYIHLGKCNNPDVLREEFYWMLDLFESDESNLLLDSIRIYPGNTPFFLRSLVFEDTSKIIERVLDGNINPMLIMWGLFMAKLGEAKDILDPQDYDDLNRKSSQILRFQDPSTGNNILHEIIRSNNSIVNKIASILLIIGHEQNFQDTDDVILFEMKNNDGKSAFQLSTLALRATFTLVVSDYLLIGLMILCAPLLLLLIPCLLFVRVFARLLFKTATLR